MELKYLSAFEIGNLVNNRIITPTDVLRYFEKRIDKYNSKVNAFVYTKFEEAYQKAKELEDKLYKKQYIGPFAGVPFALKDFLPNKPGWTNSHGGVECLISTDTEYSEFCKAMESAGGIAIGKTNAPAYGFRGVTDNKLYGPTCNPFNLKYNSGGSSGGSAAAVAAGLVPIAEGGDAGGSIRIPASWCNLFGFKPGVGTVPSVIRPDAWSATHPFCFNFGLTKTVEDAAILLNYMNYYNPRDPFSLPNKNINYKQYIDKYDNKKKRIAFTYGFNLFEVDNEIKDKIDEMVLKLKDIGYEVDFVDFNFKYDCNEISNYWCKSLIFDSVVEIENDKSQGRDYLRDHIEQFPEEITYWINECKKSNIWDLYKFNLIRTDILDNFENVFEKYDYIISATSCCLPVLNSDDRNTKGPEYINDKKIDSLIGWSTTYLVNFTGHPATSIPIGLSNNNLPIGMQIVGKKYEEEDLLFISKVIENHFPWKNNYELISL